MDLKYALGLELDDPGFDASVLSEFRTHLVEHGMEEKVLNLLLTALKDRSLVKAGGKQRTDSTRVLAAVRDLNRLEPARETLRAALEALACAAPDWLAGAMPVRERAERYGPRTHSWHPPASTSKPSDRARSTSIATSCSSDTGASCPDGALSTGSTVSNSTAVSVT